MYKLLISITILFVLLHGARCTECQDEIHDLKVNCSDCDCDSDPSVLLHCHKTCFICHESAFPQNAGFGKLPRDVSIQILQLIRDTNRFLRNDVQLNPKYALVRDSCLDTSDMCAYWAFRGQCTKDEFQDYMERTCPLTCRACVSETSRGKAFLSLVQDDLQTAYYSGPKERLANNRRHEALSLLLMKLGMDPSLLETAVTENWVWDLHTRLHAVIPSDLLKVYPTSTGPMEENARHLLADLYGFDIDLQTVASQILIPYRSRGYIVGLLRNFDHFIIRPIQLQVGFGIPNDDVLHSLSSHHRILYMGAGSGYWAGILRQRSIDVVAYDLHPPSPNGQNAFFDHAYISDIQQGSCQDVLTTNPQLVSNRTLLLSWPNDPDPIDNRHFCGDDDCTGSQLVWDADCLQAYLEAGGRRVVYVGERERNLSDNDSGLSSTRRFQTMLIKYFTLVETVSIPNWWLNEDDVTFWERNLDKSCSSDE